MSNYDLGEVGGNESVTLTINQMPMHNHLVGASNAEVPQGGTPANQVPALGSYYAPTPDTTMSPIMIQNSGGNQPHENRQPYLAMNYCIALEGIFPSRS